MKNEDIQLINESSYNEYSVLGSLKNITTSTEVFKNKDMFHIVYPLTTSTSLSYLYSEKITGIQCIKDMPEYLKGIFDDIDLVDVKDSLHLITAREQKHSDRSIWDKQNTDLDDTLHLVKPRNAIIRKGDMDIYLWTYTKWIPKNEYDLEISVFSFEKKYYTEATRLINAIEKLTNHIHKSEKIMSVVGGSNVKINSEIGWDDLVLDPLVEKATRRDIENWMKAEERYKKLNVPYRRGYLFEGPPGNGKTTVARVMIQEYDFTPYTFMFSNPQLGDAQLWEMFGTASENAPSLVLLEDIDRIFNPDTPRATGVTLDGLLNCLDGVVNYNGVVVVATANEPKHLDPAIRLRPGRFDVPVTFSNPGADLRKRYLDFVFGRCEITTEDETIDYVVKETEGMSVAFLKSIFEVAVGNSQGKPDSNAIRDAYEQVNGYYERLRTSSDRGVGFEQQGVGFAAPSSGF